MNRLLIVEYPIEHLDSFPLVGLKANIQLYSTVNAKLEKESKDAVLYVSSNVVISKAHLDITPIIPITKKKTSSGETEECYMELDTFLSLTLKNSQYKIQAEIAEFKQKCDTIRGILDRGELLRISRSSDNMLSLHIAKNQTITLSEEEFSKLENYDNESYQDLTYCIDDMTYIFAVSDEEYDSIDDTIQQQLTTHYRVVHNERKKKHEFYQKEFDIEYS